MTDQSLNRTYSLTHDQFHTLQRVVRVLEQLQYPNTSPQMTAACLQMARSDMTCVLEALWANRQS